ncbi:hypothetical protein [Entomomonas moraniae]|nr:hypothetical protein [Entomomonas moraniae]
MIQTLSVLAVPLLVAYFGANMQREVNNSRVGQEYVKLAIDILRKPPAANEMAMRSWAADIIIKYSPVGVSSEQRKLLMTSIPKPPPNAMQPIEPNLTERLVNELSE